MNSICTALILVVAMATFMLHRAAFAPSLTPYLLLICAATTIVLVIRVLVQRSGTVPSRYWLFVAGVGAYAIAVMLTAPMAPEEHLQLGLLCVASTLLALSPGARSDSWVAAIAVLLVLMGMPVLPETQRTNLIAASVVVVTMWCFVTRAPNAVFRRRQLFTGIGIAMLMGVVVLIGHQMIRPTDGNPSYAAFVPASGGDDAGSDSARSGVGEGPDEIGGNSPDSIGFDNTDTFSESGRDGLYDLWLESFGTPIQAEATQKMVGLKPKGVKLASGSDQENLRVGRRFEMHRNRPQPEQKERADVVSSAAIMLKGPLPAYVPMTTFDDYDGNVWSEESLTRQIVPVRKLPDSNWMEILLRPLSPAFDGEQVYQVRIGSLGGRVLPLPTHVEQFRMGRVLRSDFFQSTRWGGVALASRNIPAGTVIDVVCKRVDPSEVVHVEPARVGRSRLNHLSTRALSADARQMAVTWSAGHDRGWRQILQIISHLREHADLEANHVIPVGEDPIDNLLRGKRGTSYQFASAAVLMLRSAGYPTRMVSGFYASDGAVDQRSGYALLDARHTHFWCEVSLADGTWIVVDSTPGYPVLQSPVAVYEVFAGLGLRVVSGLRQNWQVAIVGVGIMSTAWVARRRIINLLATQWCGVRGYPPVGVLRVLELRAWLSGAPRPKGTPIGRWLRSLDQSPTITNFIQTVDASLYGNGEQSAPAARQALRALTLQRFKRQL